MLAFLLSVLSVNDVLAMPRLSDPRPSPDGRVVAFELRRIDPKSQAYGSEIWAVPAAGGEPRPLVQAGKKAHAPRWLPDGRLVYVSDVAGEPALWVFDPRNVTTRKLAALPGGLDEPVVSADGRFVAVQASVLPPCDAACTAARAALAGTQAKHATQLLYRHWAGWKDGKRDHVFVVDAASGETRDRTPGDLDAPPFSLGGPAGFALSPDGAELVFARNTEPNAAWSTNGDLFAVATSGGPPRRLTGSNPADDAAPQFSADGKHLYWLAQARAGYEADRWVIHRTGRAGGRTEALPLAMDASVSELALLPSGREALVVCEVDGKERLYRLSLEGPRAPMTELPTDGSLSNVSVSADGSFAVAMRSSVLTPPDVVRIDLQSGAITALTHLGSDSVRGKDLGTRSELRTKLPEGHTVHSPVLLPPGFDRARRHPLVVLVHGGPQGAWTDGWSWRWNPALFAAGGAVVIAPNFRGSTGYGQAFTDAIRGDWGGGPFRDVMAALDAAEALPYVKKGHACAAGASYGGYLVNWLAGHTDRFRCLISHAGLFDLESAYYETEELWFPEWEMKGPPWDQRSVYGKWSPSRSVTRFSTPTLVSHGELDYRVNFAQGVSMFTALQRRGVKSEFLAFPDEGHWILKPANYRLWIGAMTGFIDRHVRD